MTPKKKPHQLSFKFFEENIVKVQKLKMIMSRHLMLVNWRQQICVTISYKRGKKVSVQIMEASFIFMKLMLNTIVIAVKILLMNLIPHWMIMEIVFCI